MTPQQIQQAQALLKQQGYVPPASSGQPVSGFDQIDAEVAKRNAVQVPTNSFAGVADAIGSDYSKRADAVGQIEKSSDTPLSKTAQIAGEGFGAVSDSIGDVVKSAIKPEIMQNIGEHLAPLVDAAQKSPAGQAIISWWNGLNPETQRNLSAGGQIASLLSNAVGGGAAKAGVEAVASDAGQAAMKDAVEPIIDSGVQFAKEKAAQIKNAVAPIKEGFIPTLKPDEAVAQIIQGKPADLAAAKRTLGSIDTTGVKTYADLQKTLKAQIKPLAKQVDAELEADKSAGKSIKSFNQTVGKGANAVQVNYVQQAIADLQKFYLKTGDAEGISSMKALINKAKINGLTLKDINNLARLHGTEINAFNANGEAASGLTKQAAENTRSGLKAIARQGLHGPAAEALDAKLSDLYDTSSLIDSMVNKVNAVAQKTPKEGVIPKVVGKVVQGADMVTGGPLKAIGKAMGNIGSKGEMSAIDLEAQLEKNLGIVRGIKQ